LNLSDKSPKTFVTASLSLSELKAFALDELLFFLPRVIIFSTNGLNSFAFGSVVLMVSF